MASIIGRSLARGFPDVAVDRQPLPFVYGPPHGGVVFGHAQRNAILLGTGEDPSDDRRLMTLAMANESRG